MGIPWDSRRRWNARDACWEPWSSWKTRLKPSGGPSLPTACPSASATSFSVMRPDIDQPTTFLWSASITVARQGHPSPVPMQAIHPHCGDRKVLKGYNDLRTTHPEIAREWNKERNGDLKPTDVIASSNKRVWWKCKEGHEWSGLIANQARKGKADPGCPYCSGRKVLAGYNDLATTHPDIAAMWHPRMSKRSEPTGVQAVSRKPAWWRGECGRVYQIAVRDRVGAKPGYCPYCSGRKRPERPIRLD